MQNPFVVAVFFFVIVLTGAICGWAMRKQLLMKGKLSDETKSVVSVSMALVATISALVLGLLITNANNSFSALGGEVTTLSAQIIRLDNVLRRYGPEANPSRQMLREFAEQKAADLFPADGKEPRLANLSTYELLQGVEDSMLSLKPANDRDRWWLGQAMTLAGKIGDMGWLMAQQVGQGTPKAFLVLLAFWLALLFASFALIGSQNRISSVFLVCCALAVAGAIGMVLELENGIDGIVKVSPAPMRQALKTLNVRLSDQNQPSGHNGAGE